MKVLQFLELGGSGILSLFSRADTASFPSSCIELAKRVVLFFRVCACHELYPQYNNYLRCVVVMTFTIFQVSMFGSLN